MACCESICFLPVEEKHLAFICDVYNEYVTSSTATFHTRAQDLDRMRPLAIPPDSRYRSCVIARCGMPDGRWLDVIAYEKVLES